MYNIVVHGAPLLHKAAQAGVYGACQDFPEGGITDALFVYLEGSPSPESIRALENGYRARPLVSLSEAWDRCIQINYPDAKVYQRHQMHPACQFRIEESVGLPKGYRVALWDEDTFARHPFAHGKNYPSFDAFQRTGAGAAVWYAGEIVSSASSFLSLNGEVELDVSTLEAHRGKGLASACIRLMLQNCQERGITVHWDAQNETSLHLAEKYGFEQAFAYSVYFLPKRITDEFVVLLSTN